MTKNVFNLIILDESGSMTSIEQATISGLNETIQSIKHAQNNHPTQKHFVSLLSFNSSRKKYHFDCTPIEKIELFDGKDYCPDNCTPLYDAIGSGISKLRRQTNDDDLVLVTIITDGMENCSSEYNFKAITTLMDTMKSRGWVITYIGANQNASEEACKMHIDDALTFDATPEGVACMMKQERKARCAFYKNIDDADNEKAVSKKSFKRKFFS